MLCNWLLLWCLMLWFNRLLNFLLYIGSLFRSIVLNDTWIVGYVSFTKNAFENVICEMAAILSRPQRVNIMEFFCAYFQYIHSYFLPNFSNIEISYFLLVVFHFSNSILSLSSTIAVLYSIRCNLDSLYTCSVIRYNAFNIYKYIHNRHHIAFPGGEVWGVFH